MSVEPHIIKHQRVRLGPGVDDAGSRARPSGKKHVRPIEHEGAVRAIELTCSCGEITRVELVLDAATKTEHPAPGGAAKGRS